MFAYGHIISYVRDRTIQFFVVPRYYKLSLLRTLHLFPPSRRPDSVRNNGSREIEEYALFLFTWGM